MVMDPRRPGNFGMNEEDPRRSARCGGIIVVMGWVATSAVGKSVSPEVAVWFIESTLLSMVAVAVVATMDPRRPGNRGMNDVDPRR